MCANHTSNRDFFTSRARTFELEKELRNLRHLSQRFSTNCFLTDYSRNILNVTACLSHYLPKLSDPSMSEIDDLLYDKDTDKDVYEYITSVFSESHELKLEILGTKFYGYYEHLYLVQCGCLKSKRFLDVTFLRFVSVGNIICNSQQIFRIVRLLLTSWCVVKVCQGLKLLKVIFEKHKEYTDKHGQWINIEFIAGVTHWIKNLMKFPQARDEKHKRITDWIDLRLTATMESLCQLDIFTSSPLDDMMQLDNIFNFWGELPIDNFQVAFYLDVFLYYFLSAKTETIRRERMWNFIQEWRKDRITTKTTVDYVRYIKNGMSRISDVMNNTLVILDETIPNNKLASIEKRLRYQYDSMGAIAIKTILEVKEFWELQIRDCDVDLLEEPHFTIEEFLVLHVFIKCLKSLSIMYEMVDMAKELMESRGGVEENDNEVFKANYGVIRRHLNNIFHNKSMRGHMPWYINLTLEKCPFLFLPPRFMKALEDLVKLIKGEPIDEVTEERLYFMINNSIN